MWRSFSRIWEIVAVGLAESAVAAVATWAFNAFITNSLLRELAIVISWVLVILVGGFYLTRRATREGSAVAVTVEQPPLSTPDEAQHLPLEPDTRLTAWASNLIDRERIAPLSFLRLTMKTLDDIEHLSDAEPYFTIRIPFQYSGVLRLTIGQFTSGRLTFEGLPFAREPVVSSWSQGPLPFHGDGPVSDQLSLRQYTNAAKAAEIQGYVERNTMEIELWALDFTISVRLNTFDGELIYDGPLLGERLTCRIPRS